MNNRVVSILLAAAFSTLLLKPAQAVDPPLMRISIRIYERPVDYPAVPATVETGQVNLGQDFVVKVLVEDIRPAGQNIGVFASYVDVNFDDGNLASLVPSLPGVVHPQTGNPTAYVHNEAQFGGAARPLTGDGLIDTDMNGSLNQIDVFGSFSGSFQPIGPGEFILAEFAMTAENPGLFSIFAEPTSEDPAIDPEDLDESPLYDNLLFGIDDPICPSQSTFGCVGSIEFVGDSIFLGIEVFSDGFESP